MPARFEPHSAAVREDVRRLYVEDARAARCDHRQHRRVRDDDQGLGESRGLAAAPASDSGRRQDDATPASESRRSGQAAPPKRTATEATRLPAPLVAIGEAVASALSPASLKLRILHLIALKLTEMERQMSAGNADANPERDMRALNGMMQSIDKLKDLEPGHGNAGAADPKSRRAPATVEEEDRLRLEIVERMLKLRERARSSRRGWPR